MTTTNTTATPTVTSEVSTPTAPKLSTNYQIDLPAKAIKQFAAVCAKLGKSSMPILNHALVSKNMDGAGVTLKYTNLDVFVTCTVEDAEVRCDGEWEPMTFPFKTVGKFVRDGKLETLTLIRNGASAIASGSGIKMAIETFCASDFPVELWTHKSTLVPIVEETATSRLSTQSIKAIKDCLTYASTDYTRSVLNGVNIQHPGVFIATDGRRLLSINADGGICMPRMHERGTTIPTLVCELMIDLFGKSGCRLSITHRRCVDKVREKAGNTRENDIAVAIGDSVPYRFSFVCTASNYPNHHQVIPKYNKREYIQLTPDIIGLLKIASKNEKHAVSFKWAADKNGGAVMVSAHGIDEMASQCEIKVGAEVKSFEMSLDSRFLLDAIKIGISRLSIKPELIGDHAPGKYTQLKPVMHQGNGMTFVLMPMRIN